MPSEQQEERDWVATTKTSSGNSKLRERKRQVNGERCESKSEIKQREERDRTDGMAWQH